MTAPHIESLPLREGEHLDQKTFHERYEQMPDNIKAELIGGVVYMPSPLLLDHAYPHFDLNLWLGNYMLATPGIRGADNASVILGKFSEPQPDTLFHILPEYGGQAHRNSKGYIEGAPELLVEVAVSSEHYDLHIKRHDYEARGVQEYIVILVREERVVWFVRSDTGFVELAPGSDGILRSPLFGGLWLDPAALLRLESARVLEVLQQGLKSPEHAAFVARLHSQRKLPSNPGA